MGDPQAQEAFTVAEAAWYEANGIEPAPGTEAWARKLAQDMWAAALQWAAQQLHDYRAVYFIGNRVDGLETHRAVDLLRQETSTPSPEGKP